MIATASVDELLGNDGIDSDADAAIAAVLAKAGLSPSDFEVVEAEDDGEAVTMTAAAKIAVEPRAKQAATPEEITTLVTEQLATLDERARATTDERLLREIQDRSNNLDLLRRIAPYMPAKVTGSVRFGHSESECFAFNTPTVRGVHDGGLHTFNNNVYETSDPVEIGALLRIVAEGFESDDTLIVLGPKAEAYKDRYGRILGWERPGSANVKRWVKLNMLRTGG